MHLSIGELFVIDLIRKKKAMRSLINYSGRAIAVAALLLFLSDVVRTAQFGFVEGGEAEVLLKNYFTEVSILRNTYTSEFDRIGWESMLDADRLNNDTDLSESKKIVQKALEIHDVTEKKATILGQDVKADIRNLNVPEDLKRDMLRGLDEGIDKRRKSFQQLRDLLGLVKNIILFLNSTEWTVDGEQILFANDKDVAKYNFMMEGLQTSAVELEKKEQQRIRSFCENHEFAHIAEELCREG